MKNTQHLGRSFAELTAAAQQLEPVKTDPSQLPPAGVISGAGRLQSGQNTVAPWSQSDASACKLAATTEAHSQYRPPRAGTTRQDPVRPPATQIPNSDFPGVLKSVTQADFHPHVVQRAAPCNRGSKMKDSGSLLSVVNVKADFATQTASIFKAHTQNDWTAANSRAAGHPATHAVNYNIIHGGPAIHNPYDAWMHGHDYRKTRPAS